MDTLYDMEISIAWMSFTFEFFDVLRFQEAAVGAAHSNVRFFANYSIPLFKYMESRIGKRRGIF